MEGIVVIILIALIMTLLTRSSIKKDNIRLKKNTTHSTRIKAHSNQKNAGCLVRLWHGFCKFIKVMLMLFGILFIIAFISALTNDDNKNTEQSSSPTAKPTIRATSTTIPTKQPTKQPTKAPTATPQPTQTPTPEQESYFEIHFLDVGQADSALVLCDGKSMLIDGGDSKDSSLIYAYLKDNGIKHLDYIVATHGHSDHVGGLSGALNYATVSTVLCSTENYDNEEFSDFVRYLEKQNAKISVPKHGDAFTLGSSSFEIVAPMASSEIHNNTSLVLRLVYGDTSFLFTGDAEMEEETDILFSNYTIGSTVLKVGHHGSSSSTSHEFLKKVSPKYAVISVGKDNQYNFPSQETIETLRDANVKVFRTDMQGTIICTSDGKEVKFSVTKNADADTLPTATPEPTPTPKATKEPAKEPTKTTYILNTNTKKFHYSGCGSVKKMKESNKKQYTGTREEVIKKGYSPCGNCKP